MPFRQASQLRFFQFEVLKTAPIDHAIFTRRGDEFNQREEEIRYGIKGKVDYEWIYR